MDAAYCRIHTNACIASTCINIVYKLDLLCLGLPFVMTPTPADYNTVIESSMYLCNDILRRK